MAITITRILIAGLAVLSLAVHALPSTIAAEPGLLASNLLNRDEVPNQCPAGQPMNERKCSPDALAIQGACAQLIQDYSSSHNPIKKDPRSICKTYPGLGQCCFSWSNIIYGASEIDVANAAVQLSNGCVDSTGKVSGRLVNTIIGSSCTTLCLSNRATHCSSKDA